MASIREALVGALMLASLLVSPVIAGDLRTSGKNAIADNPFVAYGINPSTQVVTGYLIGLRTSPGRTDECRFAFAGNLRNTKKFSVKYLSEINGYETGGSVSFGAVKSVGGELLMKIKKNQLGGECDWILPFINEPRVKESSDEVEISFGSLRPGDWIGVFAIKSARALFHNSTDESSAQNAFLIQGDLIYVYDEKPGWYYVKYERRKKTTVGWIKKSDTVQIGS